MMLINSNLLELMSILLGGRGEGEPMIKQE